MDKLFKNLLKTRETLKDLVNDLKIQTKVLKKLTQDENSPICDDVITCISQNLLNEIIERRITAACMLVDNYIAIKYPEDEAFRENDNIINSMKYYISSISLIEQYLLNYYRKSINAYQDMYTQKYPDESLSHHYKNASITESIEKANLLASNLIGISNKTPIDISPDDIKYVMREIVTYKDLEQQFRDISSPELKSVIVSEARSNKEYELNEKKYLLALEALKMRKVQITATIIISILGISASIYFDWWPKNHPTTSSDTPQNPSSPTQEQASENPE